MSGRTGSFRRLGRQAGATLLAMSAVAIAAGCATTQWVPVAQAPPKGESVRLKVPVPRGSASTATRKMTLFYPRMEGDSVVTGTPVRSDWLMSQKVRVQAKGTLVGVEHYGVIGVLRTAGVVVGSLFVLFAIMVASEWNSFRL